MSNCRECRFWNRDQSKYVDPEDLAECLKIPQENKVWMYPLIRVYTTAEDGQIEVYTSPRFGCDLFENR